MTGSAPQTASRRLLLIALVATFAVAGVLAVRNCLALQPAGADFLCFWTGGRVALDEPSRLYDFAHVSALQPSAWTFGSLRPYINPPAALLLFAPLSRLPFWASYALLMLISLSTLAVAGARVRAPWWLLLLPAVAFSIYCGQFTLLLGGLILLGLGARDRPWLAGVFYGLAACLKPQLLILLPVALAADRQWRTVLATGATGVVVCGLSALVFGLQPWFDWFAALPRFHQLVLGERSLLLSSIAPYARLAALGWNGAWAWVLAPAAIWGVWTTFRGAAPWPDRLIALVGGALLIAPYAMNYELALFVPAVAAYLTRTEDRRWPLYAVAATVYAMDAFAGALSLVAVLALPLMRVVEPAPAPAPVRA